jgi:hypothetical protein
VEPNALRASLIVPLDRLSAKSRELTGDAEDPFAAADVIVSAMAIERASSGITSLLRNALAVTQT